MPGSSPGMTERVARMSAAKSGMGFGKIAMLFPGYASLHPGYLAPCLVFLFTVVGCAGSALR